LKIPCVVKRGAACVWPGENLQALLFQALEGRDA
jgi:hypothetical protein